MLCVVILDSFIMTMYKILSLIMTMDETFVM
jgi:hypothetical protein